MQVLVIDVGGSSVKCMVWGKTERRKFSSGKDLTAEKFVQEVRSLTRDWHYDRISIGFPGLVLHGEVAAEPPNLGPGWVSCPLTKRFERPVRIINDAAMQALGSYEGGRMLFLGLGTGVGSTLILDDVVVPLELGELSWPSARSLGTALGKAGLKRRRVKSWTRHVHQAVGRLAKAFGTDYVVIGGGNVELLKKLPPRARRGSNDNAFVGGARLWGLAQLSAKPRKHTWTIT